MNEKFGIITTADKIFYTENSGKKWEKSDTNFGYNGFDIINQNEGFIFTFPVPNGMKTGKNLNWTKINSSFYHDFSFISFASSQTGWLASNSIRAKLRKTNDRGKNWQEVILPEDMRAVLAICLVNENLGYILDYNLKIYKTKDSGNTWEIIPLNLKKYNYACTDAEPFRVAMRFYNEDNGVIIIYQIKPHKNWVSFETADSGKTWDNALLPGDEGFVSITHDGKFLSILGSSLFVLKQKI